MKVATVILAAGLGKRMKSRRAKVLHRLAGRPMVLYAVDAAEHLPSERIIVVVSHQAGQVREVLGGRRVEIVDQGTPLGTGHAVSQTQSILGDFKGPVLILNADVPLITPGTIQSMLAVHTDRAADLTLLTAQLDNPAGYGRILRDGQGRVSAVIEEADAGPREKALREINTGFYLANGPFLFSALKGVTADNAQREYYLTDIVRAAVRKGLNVGTVEVPNPEEILGVNTRADLARLQKAAFRRIADRLMAGGVTLMDPDTAWIDAEAVIESDTVIHPNVRIEGACRIGEDCRIHSHTRITDCRIGRGVTIRDCCVLAESVLEDGVTVGPFAHLRAGSRLGRNARIGNFVETKKTTVGEGSKANHLSYLGDAEIGREVNIGAGTITCNYDGAEKHRTEIGDRVFVGSDTQFVAPVTIGEGAVIGAGSTITEDVPPDALALSRAKQTTKKGWARSRRSRQTKKLKH